MSEKYCLRFFFEWGGGPCLWPQNDSAYQRFGFGQINYEELPLSSETIERANELEQWNNRFLNWESPSEQAQVDQEECDSFDTAARQLLDQIRNELGSKYEVINEQVKRGVNLSSDEYLENPRKYHV